MVGYCFFNCNFSQPMSVDDKIIQYAPVYKQLISPHFGITIMERKPGR